jgi:hypothetical protein
MSNIANATFSYQETITGAIMPQISEQFDLEMSVILDNTDTLSSEIGTIGAAGRNEANAKKKQIHKQALGQAVQGLGQFATAGVTGIGTYKANNNDTIKELQGNLAGIESNEKALTTVQENFKGSSLGTTSGTATAATDEIVMEQEDEVNPAITTRQGQFELINFEPASEELQRQWANSLAPQGENESDEDYANRCDLDKQTMLHMATDPDNFKSVLSSLESKISDLNKQAGVTSDKLTNKLSMYNNYVSVFKDLTGATSSLIQSGITATSAKWSTTEIMNQNISAMANMMMQVLEKMLQQAYDGINGITNSVVSSAQITASAA